jgi:hypothetical protein
MHMHTYTTLQAIKGCSPEDRKAFDRLVRINELGVYESLSWSADGIIQRIRELYDGKIGVSWTYYGGKSHSVKCVVEVKSLDDKWQELGTWLDDNPVAAFIHCCAKLEKHLQDVSPSS